MKTNTADLKGLRGQAGGKTPIGISTLSSPVLIMSRKNKIPSLKLLRTCRKQICLKNWKAQYGEGPCQIQVHWHWHRVQCYPEKTPRLTRTVTFLSWTKYWVTILCSPIKRFFRKEAQQKALYSEMYLTTLLRWEATTIRARQTRKEKKNPRCSCESSGANIGTPPVTHNGSPVLMKAQENEITALHWILIVF